MGYRLIADAAMVTHFAFLAFLAIGGFLAWRWPRLLWIHLPVAFWGLVIVITRVPCPLTAVENWGRRNAGLHGLPESGFIDHYIEGVIYPQEYTRLAQALVAILVIGSWAGFAARRRRPGRARGWAERRGRG